MSRKKDIKVDLNELREIFENDPSPKAKIGLSLLEKADFMNKTMKNLQKEIKAQGTITIMPQGSYAIDRINPALTAYNTTIKNYTSVCKQLIELVDRDKISKDDGFGDF